MSSSDIVSGAFGVIGGVVGTVTGVVLTLYLQSRSESKKREQDEYRELKQLDARLMEAVNTLLSHRGLNEDKLAPIDGGKVEKSNPSSQEFKSSLAKALEAFPFPTPDVDDLISSNTWGAAAISLARQWRRDVERINLHAADLHRKVNSTRREASEFLSEAGQLVEVSNLIDAEAKMHGTVLRGVFDIRGDSLTTEQKEYIERETLNVKHSTEDLYESIKNFRVVILAGSKEWESFLQKIDWPET